MASKKTTEVNDASEPYVAPKEGTTQKPAQESAVSLEDAIKTGAMSTGDLDEDATMQVTARNRQTGDKEVREKLGLTD